MRIHATNLKASVDDVEYNWYGYIGTIIISYENGIKSGELRMIGDVMFKVLAVHSKIGKNCVHWGLCGSYDTGYIQEFKRELFDL
jgi:hypothetical protein